MKTVVGLYDDIEDARDVVDDLVDAGIARDDISLIARDVTGEYSTYLEEYDEDYDYEADYDYDDDDVGEAAAGGAVGGAIVGGLIGVLVGLGTFVIPGLGPVVAAGPLAAGLAGAGIGAAAGGLLGALVEWGIPEEEAEYYAEGVRRGSTLVAVKVADAYVDDVVEIMNENDPVDIERRAEYWREEYDWEGYDVEAEPYTAEEIEEYRTSREEWWEEDEDELLDLDEDEEEFYEEDLDLDEEETLEVVEEELRVGKRRVGGGTVRVHKWVEEVPVSEDVAVTDEHVTVERRAVDRPADADDLDFEEETIEMRESAEEVVVDKRARVIEEVVIGKEVDTHVETVSDTVRRTHVDVDEGAEIETADVAVAFVDVEPRFREHYDTYYTTTDYTYDQYAPAYRYGYNLATDPYYGEREWSEIETDVETRWEEHNEGTWEEFKDAVQDGWHETKEALGLAPEDNR